MSRCQLQVRKGFWRALLVFLLTVIVPILYAGSAMASNTTFTPFQRSDYPAYLGGNQQIAEEIAYYANYIIPILGSRSDGCLGARPTDANIFREDELNKDNNGAKVAYHVSRCNYLFPSDYARLNYIIALNANYKGDLSREKGTLRYISRTSKPEDYNLSDSFQAGASQSATSSGPSQGSQPASDTTNNSQTTNASGTNEIKRTIVNDTDAQYIEDVLTAKVELGIGVNTNALYTPATKVVPIGTGTGGASEAKIQPLSQLTNYFIPNVKLSNSDNATLFGFNPDPSVNRYKMHYGYMYYNVINYALKDCGQSSLAKLTPKNDSVVNQRAVMLNPENVIGEVLTTRLDNLNKCKNQCDKDEAESDNDGETTKIPANQTSKCLSEIIKEKIDSYHEEGSDNNFNQYFISTANTAGVPESDHAKFRDKFKLSSRSLRDKIVDFTDKIAIDFRARLNAGRPVKNAIEESFQNNQSELNELFNTSTVKKLLISSNEMENYLNIIATNLILDINKPATYLAMEKCGDKFAETNSKCINECNRSYGLSIGQPTPNCSLLTRVLQQVDDIDQASNFVNNVDTAYQVPKWLPLTDNEKHIMGFGDTSRLGQGGDTDIDPDFELHEPYKSTCYFTGFASFICTFTNFLARLADSAFYAIESLVRFPSPTLDTSTGEHNFYSSWKIFRDLANIVLVIVLTISIVSQVSGWRLDQMGLRRTLPKILVAGAMINLSFYICQLAVDLSNMVGQSIRDFFDNSTSVLLQNSEFYYDPEQTPVITSLADDVMSFLVIGGVATLAALFFAIRGLFLLLPVIVAGLVTVATNVFILIFRQVLVFLLILVAPIVFAVSALSPNNSLTKRWWQMLSAILLAYPLISMAFSIGNLAYNIVSATVIHSNNDAGLNWVLQVLAISLLILPILLVPKVMQNIIKNLPVFGSQIRSLGSRLSQGTQKRIDNTNLVKRARSNRALQQLQHHRQDDTDEDTKKWLKEREENMRKDRFGNDTTPNDALQAVRNFNSSSGDQNEVDAIASALINMADDGGGSYEDVILAFSKLSSLNLSSQKLQALKNSIIKNYQANGRFDVTGLIENASDINPAFAFGSTNDPTTSLDQINQTIYGTTNAAGVQVKQSAIIQDAFAHNHVNDLISGPKFKGFGTNSGGAGYRNETSWQAARDAVQSLYNTDPVFQAALDRNSKARNATI